jgi:CheY-like chemotaxis protein
MATILCIDDEQAGLTLRRALLESKGYTVLTATDGETGIELVRTRRPDAVILDWRMPAMDGGQVAKFLKAKYPSLPIVLLTGWPKNLPPTLLASIDGFVQKGDPVTVLLSAIRALLKAHRSHKPLTHGKTKLHVEKSELLDVSRKRSEEHRSRHI